MIRVRRSRLVLLCVFFAFLVMLLVLRHALRAAHLDETIDYFSSDGSVYFSWYETVYADSNVLEDWSVFLRGSPVLFMLLSNGNLLLVQAGNLALMLVSLKVAMDSLDTYRGRMLFLALSLIFPYFVFGFLSLNKEVYAMCSAIFFGSYLIRGHRMHLVTALVLAVCARYFMVAALLMLIVTVPRDARPRYGLIFVILLMLSLAAAISKTFAPEFMPDDLLESSGTSAVIFASVIDNFGYAPIYPIKYMLLVPTRAYSFIFGGSSDSSGAVVSICSTAIVLTAAWLWLSRRPLNPMVRRFIVAGFVGPIPIMWSEIMHWRYYSFVYFFFLYGVILHFVERPRCTPTQHITHPYA